MKTLHLLRHAKSDWDDAALTDHQRPLSRRGVNAAKAMGRTLAAEGFQVDHIYCSTAQRARETYKLLGTAVKGIPTTFHDELYLVSVDDVLAFIRRAQDTAGSIMIVGHNPTTHDLAMSFAARARKGRHKMLQELREKYPTGALCTLRFNVARWRNVKPARGILERFLRPRDLPTVPVPR
jgi:phosphohistidine phosphatase